MESAQHFLMRADGRPILWSTDGHAYCGSASLPITPLRAAMIIQQYEPAPWPPVWDGGALVGTWYRRARQPSSDISCDAISAIVSDAPNQTPQPSSLMRSQDT